MSDASTLFWLAAASCVAVFDAFRALVLRIEPLSTQGLAASRFDHGEKRTDRLAYRDQSAPSNFLLHDERR